MFAILLVMEPAAAAAATDSSAAAAPGQSVGLATNMSTNGNLVTVATTLAAPKGPAFAPERVIVRFRQGTSFMAGSGRSVALHKQHNIHLVDNPPGLSVAEMLAHYRDHPNVIYAEPDYTVTTLDTTPNDSYYLSKQWDMAKIAAPKAWDLHKYSNATVVAVVDTGIDFNHLDLVANLYTDPSDSTLHGYTCMNGTCAPGGFDDHGHGTHVAGTIGADTNNSRGVAGINWEVQLLAIKFLSASGSGSTSDAVLGFQLLQTLKEKSGVNIRVTNNSWGGGGYSQALKDAMAALETGLPSTLNVCAAGNSGVNADFTPMYPAAFDNRGIVSVLASDINDAGASFTNYGVASVDIAAPGVNIFSTESTGNCSLCDSSGYRALNGTSMASPHVAGVAAALLDAYPELTAYQARDALLRPASYDWMTNTKAQSTSSGGRLNFYKVLTNNEFLTNPVLNQFPTVSVGPDAYVSGGATVNFTQQATDPDGDTLRTTIGKGAVGAGVTWMLGWQVNQSFPNSVPFTAPQLARMAVVPYDITVADNRGGGASARNLAVVSLGTNPGKPPTGVLTAPETGTVNVAVPISFVASDPDNDPVAWDLFTARQGGNSGSCCFTGPVVNWIFSSVGNYRITVQAMDRKLTSSETYTKVIAISDGASTPSNGSPPLALAKVTPESGPAPLTVDVDLSGSTDEDGSITNYFNGCGGSFAYASSSPYSTCTFTTPGTYWLQFHVKDNAGNLSPVSRYVVVYPVSPGAPTPPAAPTNLMATADSATQISLGWTDNANNEDAFKIERSLDNGTNWYLLATVGANVVSYDDSGLASGKTYWYRVRASNSTGDSGYSNTASAQTPVAMTIQFEAAAYPVTEANTTLSIPVTRSTGSGTVTVAYATADGSALAGRDYTAKSGSLSFSAGVTRLYLSVPILNDALYDPDETFTVTLSNPSSGNLGTPAATQVTISDDNDRNLEFESASYTVAEDAGSVTLKVKRLGSATSSASVKYATANGSARSKNDYTTMSGTLTWAASDTASKPIVVPIINDTTREGAETFVVKLSTATGATIGTIGTATVIISAND